MSADVPRQGQFWRHAKGGLYEVIAVGKMESDQSPVVIYQREGGTGDVWVRPLANFLERFRRDLAAHR